MLDRLTLFIVVVNFCFTLLIAFLMLSNPLRVNKSANIRFGVFLLLWASFWVDEVLKLNFNLVLNHHWQFVLRYLQYHTPMLFFFTALFYANPNYKFNKYAYLHIIPSLIYLLCSVLFFYTNILHEFLQYFLLITMLTQSSVYLLFTYLKIRKHQKNIQLFSSNTMEVDLAWLERIILGMLVVLIVVAIYNIIFTFESLGLTVNLIVLLVILDMSYHAMRQKEIYPFSEDKTEEILQLEEEQEQELMADVELKKKIIPDADLVQLRTELHEFMLREKPYLDSDLNLVKLSEQFGQSSHRLSYIINNGFNKNFFNYINEYRVMEAKKLLLDPKMSQFSLIGIAYEAGFSSKTAFNTTFKKITGQTPSEFKKSSSDL